MKKVLFLCALLLSSYAYSQEVDYNAIILPANAVDLTIEEKLVQLAWKNNPENHTVIKQSAIARYQVKKAHWAWLDYFGARGNLNEFTIDPDPEVNSRAAFYPRYNFFVGFTLGSLGTNALNVKQSRVQASIAEDQIKSQKLAVRAEVLSRYYEYLLAKEKLKVQQDVEEESYAQFKVTEGNFKTGKESVQNYNNILERYTNHRLRRLETETQFQLTKIAVEALIGMKLEIVTGTN